MVDKMLREVITYTTEQAWLEARVNDITSTEVSALFGLSPYMTKFELWHRKKAKQVVSIEPNERMKWGTRLQDSIAIGICTDNDWTGWRIAEYVRLPDYRIGSSFDWDIFPNKAPYSIDDRKHSLLEIKNVDSIAFKNGWAETEEGLEAPAHIELQAQHQLLVYGYSSIYIGALIGGNKVTLLKRQADSKVHKAIIDAVCKFWESIADNNPPPPDFTTDVKFINELYSHAEPNSFLDCTWHTRIVELVKTYQMAQSQEIEWKERKEAAKAEIKTIVGASERVIVGEYSINMSLTAPVEIKAHTRAGYRQFKITKNKEKS